MKIIKKGYKQTEFGVIPEDWNIMCLGDFSSEIAEGPFGSNLKSEHYTNKKEARIIQLSNIGECGWNDDNIKYTSYTHAKEISKCIVNPGEIVIAKMMPAGRAIICPDEESMYILSSDAIKFKPKNNINKRYLQLTINSVYFRRQIQNKTQGSTRARTNIAKLIESKIIVPSFKSEQCAIATALSDIDSLISSLNKKIEKKKAFKQGLMQQLLTGKKRLPGFNGEWIEKKLGDIGEIVTGSTPPRDNPKNWDGKINWITSKDFTAKYIKCSKETITKEALKYCKLLNPNSILITCIASIGLNAITKGECATNQQINAIVCHSSNYYEFVYYQMVNNSNMFKALAAQTAVPIIPKSVMSQFSVEIPKDFEEQTAIATILSDIDKDISAIEASRDKYIQIKSAMMQQLLTGKIRLVEPLQEKECSDEAKVIPIDAHIVGGHIVKKLYASKGWGRTKFQKSLHLIGYCCQLNFGNEYIRNTAGPDDERLMDYIDSKLIQYNQIVKEKEILSNGYIHYIYRPTKQIVEIEQAFESYPIELKNNIDSLLYKISSMDLKRAEIVSTLYAVWNNRINKGQEISDSLILSDFYDWSKHKSDFSKDLVLKALNYMRNNDIIPIGWGKYIDKK